jgi:hypothetical protein
MFPVVEKLGGIDETLRVIERRRGKRLTERAVWRWREFGSVPAANRLALQEELLARGILFSSRDFEPTVPIRHRKAEPSSA